MSTLKNTLRDNKWACWLALACLVVPMFASYFFDDMFSSLSELFKNPEYLELGWNMADYGQRIFVPLHLGRPHRVRSAA